MSINYIDLVEIQDAKRKEVGEGIEGAYLTEDQYTKSRERWGAMALSAIMRCAGREDVGFRKFLELADTTQRELVGKVAKEFYAKEFNLMEDSIETFFKVTSLGVVGCGFEYEVDAGSTDEKLKAEQYRCPIVDHAHMAGYKNGDSEFDDLGLWCDTYDNFESAAVAPSQGMVHSHCIGRNDRMCRWYIETLEPEVQRQEGEHIYDYTHRMRAEYRERQPDGPWVLDGKTQEETDQLVQDNVSVAHRLQDEIAPTWRDKNRLGSDIWGRIGAVSTVMAGKLLGYDNYVDTMSEKQGPNLQIFARERAEECGITGDSVNDAVSLHNALIVGQGFGAYEINQKSTECIEGACTKCPIAEWAGEAGMAEEAKGISTWCSAARTYEAQVIDENISHTYTHCLANGDAVCRWVIEKNKN